MKRSIFNFGIVPLIMGLSTLGTIAILKEILKAEDKKGESICK